MHLLRKASSRLSMLGVVMDSLSFIDDMLLMIAVKDFLVVWPILEQVLGAAGLRLKAAKCRAWIPEMQPG
eukprot:3050706-Lingulodinium_polyedra.AAC.1